MKFSKIKLLLVKNDLKCGISCLALLINAGTLYMKCYLGMNSVSRLCLSLRDTALNVTCHLTCVDG